jgi:hypothetical protein
MPVQTQEMTYDVVNTFVKSKRQRRWEKQHPGVPFYLLN